MSKTITIEIPVTIPDGWEFVEWRAARYNDFYVDNDGGSKRWYVRYFSTFDCAIIRKVTPKPWKPVDGEEVWILHTGGSWSTLVYAEELWTDEYAHGTIYPATTTDDQRKTITARVHALHMEIHAERDGVGR